MSKVKKLLLAAAIFVVMMLVCVGCGYDTVHTGSTGVIMVDGVVQDKYVEGGRFENNDKEHKKLVIVDNKILTKDDFPGCEAQSKDDIIVNASSYAVSFRIGAGSKSVWLVRNVSIPDSGNWKDIIPNPIVESALKDALLEVEAKNVTKRIYVEPLFKRILQERLDEHFGYNEGKGDTSLVTVNSVAIGNLSPQEEYDKELSRSQILAKKAENDKKQAQLDQEKASTDAEVELAKVKAKAEVDRVRAKTEAEVAKLEAEKEAAKWEVMSKYFTSEQIARMQMFDQFTKGWDGKYYNDPLFNAMLKMSGVDGTGAASQQNGDNKE
jgi:regulator of protease activity HflC (stomatin/prohibitin superfamily)